LPGFDDGPGATGGVTTGGEAGGGETIACTVAAISLPPE
jgi:hypothetical protein